MPDRPRTWGFRLSAVDAVVLAAAAPLTWLLWRPLGGMALAVPFAVGHFFLFCNVFRIHRAKELVWAAVALANISAWTIADALWWPGVLAVQTPLTALLIVREIRGPWYHGIRADRWNPRLEDYLGGRL